MGLFGKKDKKEEIKRVSQTIPELPELPKLPELPPMHSFSNEEDEHLPQLPTFPNNSLGNKFSQNTIKEAVAGKKEDEEVFDAEDFPEEHMGMMQKPLKKSFSKEYETYEQSITSKPEKSFSKEYDEDDSLPEIEGKYERSIPAVKTKPQPKEVSQDFAVKNYMTKKAEPVFIRIDKFEESMKIFQDIRSQISEIEKLIKNTKEIKAKEEEELKSWETEVQAVKNQIEKVNQDIFSRVE
jgi:hypothetical protein